MDQQPSPCVLQKMDVPMFTLLSRLLESIIMVTIPIMDMVLPFHSARTMFQFLPDKVLLCMCMEDLEIIIMFQEPMELSRQV